MAIHFTEFDRRVRVSHNGNGCVLVTITDEESQARAVLTPKQAMGIIVDMLEQLEKMEHEQRITSE